MIKFQKPNRVLFTGKHEKQLTEVSKRLGLSPQATFTGMMWEMIMQKAREGLFLKANERKR